MVPEVDSSGVYGRPLLSRAVGERNPRRGASACASGCGRRLDGFEEERNPQRGECGRCKSIMRRSGEKTRRARSETTKAARGGLEPVRPYRHAAATSERDVNLRKPERVTRTRSNNLRPTPLEGRKTRQSTRSSFERPGPQGARPFVCTALTDPGPWGRRSSSARRTGRTRRRRARSCSRCPARW